MAARGLYVGGGGLQRPLRRVAGPADPVRDAVFQAGVRHRHRVSVAAGRVRILGRAATTSETERAEVLHHPEDLVVSVHPVPVPYVHVGGDRRHGDPDAFSPCGHVQLLARREAGAVRGAELPGEGSVLVSVAPVRVRGRRRRAHEDAHREDPSVRRFRGDAEDHVDLAQGLLPPAGGGQKGSAHVGGGDLSGTAPRDPDHAGV